ncbi:MAG: hypothetical protein ACHQ0J_09380 [Candidatus Dormibacterales bacterium]
MAKEVQDDMYLAIGSFMPPAHGSLGSADWTVALLTMAGFVVAVVAMMVFGNRTVKATKFEEPPIELKKAA